MFLSNFVQFFLLLWGRGGRGGKKFEKGVDKAGKMCYTVAKMIEVRLTRVASAG